MSGHTITRCESDQQIHTDPNAVKAVRLAPFSTSPPSIEGSAHSSRTIGASASSEGRSQAASGYSTASAMSTKVSARPNPTSRAYSITATTASVAASAAVVPCPEPDRKSDDGGDQHPCAPLLNQLRLAGDEDRDAGRRQDRHRDPHEEHRAAVEVNVQRTQVHIERHPPIEMKKPQIGVDDRHRQAARSATA